SPLAVAVEPQSGKRAGAAFEIGRGDVVENQRPLPQMPPGQRLLDALLLFHQPVERRIKLLLVNPPELEHLAQRASRRLAIKTARSRQLGRRIDKPCHDHGIVSATWRAGCRPLWERIRSSLSLPKRPSAAAT